MVVMDMAILLFLKKTNQDGGEEGGGGENPVWASNYMSTLCNMVVLQRFHETVCK